MSEIDEIRLFISEMETKLARVRKKRACLEEQISKQANQLEREIEDGNMSQEALLRAKKVLSQAARMVNKEADLNSLEEIKKMVDDIYGDQSDNSTYYFTRKQEKNASVKEAGRLKKGDRVKILAGENRGIIGSVREVTPRGIKVVIGNEKYGKVQTFDRQDLEEVSVGNIRQRASSIREAMELEKAMKQMDALYGDQSDNRTYYPSRRMKDEDAAEMSAIWESKKASPYDHLMCPFDNKKLQAVVDFMRSNYGIPVQCMWVPKFEELHISGGWRVPNEEVLEGTKQKFPYITYTSTEGYDELVFGMKGIKLSSKEASGDWYAYDQASDMEMKSSQTLMDIAREMDLLYGDQSENETFYPSRRMTDEEAYEMSAISDEEEDVLDANWSTEEQYRITSPEFDEFGESKQAEDKFSAGYFKQDDFEDHNPLPSYRGDGAVPTQGYWGDEADEQPHAIEDRDEYLDSLLSSD